MSSMSLSTSDLQALALSTETLVVQAGLSLMCVSTPGSAGASAVEFSGLFGRWGRGSGAGFQMSLHVLSCELGDFALPSI